MADQAKYLRGLMERRQVSIPFETPRDVSRRARTIAVTSGKGGVGKSCIALNLSIALARLGQSVCLLDACLGLGNIDLLCGLNGYWNLSHVMNGARSLNDVILQGPEGISVIPGASGLIELADCPDSVQQDLLRQMEQLEQTHDVLVVDTSTGIHRIVRQFATAADRVLIVTVPETTALADAYATVKALASPEAPPLDLVVNQAESSSQAKAIAARLQQTSRMFLQAEVGFAGQIARDPAVVRAVANREPFLVGSPNSAASTDILQLAKRLVSSSGSNAPAQSYFDRFHNRQTRRA